MVDGLSPDTLAAFQQQGWIPGGNPAPPSMIAAPPPQPFDPAQTAGGQAALGALGGGPAAPPAPAPYVPIGAVQPTHPAGSHAPGNISQEQADAALAAALTNGGPVAPKAAAGAGGLPSDNSALPPVAAGPATPAGMQPLSQSVEIKGGVPITPQLAQSERDYGGATQDVQNAQGEVSALAPGVAAVRAREEALYRVHAADQAAKYATDAAQATTEENWKRDKAHAAYDLAISKGVDRNKYWHDQSFGGKLGTLASIALGGIGAGISGIWGSNPGNGALKMVQDGIEQDIHEQTEAIDRKGKLSDEADNHVALFLKEGLNKQQAQQAAASLAWTDFQKTLDEKAANLPAMQRLQAAQLQQAIAQKKGEHDMAFAKETGDVATRKVEDKWKAASGGGGGDDWAAAYRKYRKEQVGKLDSKTGQPELLMTPGEFHARWQGGGANPTAAAGGAGQKTSARLAMGQAAADAATSALDTVADLEKNHHEFWAAGKEKGSGAVDQARTAMALARVPQGEIDRLFPKDYNPTDVHLTGGPAQRIEEAKKLIKQQQNITNTAVAHTQGREEVDPEAP